MKTLSLLRHAEASWDDPSLSDFDRPLNLRGQQDAPRMGAYLKARGFLPQQIVSSPALRAITTAGMAGAELGVDESAIQREPAIYEAGVDDLMQIVQGLDDSRQHIMLVGHNPGISMLANRLTGERYELPTCGYLSLELNIDQWIQLTSGLGRALVFYRPSEIDL